MQTIQHPATDPTDLHLNRDIILIYKKLLPYATALSPKFIMIFHLPSQENRPLFRHVYIHVKGVFSKKCYYTPSRKTHSDEY